jgi:hypothetical protein
MEVCAAETAANMAHKHNPASICRKALLPNIIERFPHAPAMVPSPQRVAAT